jgi:formiminotetrahydrofolate cyclodeaminase
MIDFKRLNDPILREKMRVERLAEEERIEAETQKISEALDVIRDGFDALSEKDRKFFISVRASFSVVPVLSEPQKKWLFDIVERLMAKPQSLVNVE